VIEADYEEVDASMLQTTKRIIHEDVRSDAARVEYGKLDLKAIKLVAPRPRLAKFCTTAVGCLTYVAGPPKYNVRQF
jgi:hypothetical protein